MIKPRHLALVILLLLNAISNAQCTYTAVNDGNWNSPSTWVKSDCSSNQSTIPMGNCRVIIPSNKSVNFTITNVTVFSLMSIYVEGRLLFDEGKKLYLDCNSFIEIAQGGKLVGDNHGSKISLCDVWIWQGEEVNGIWTSGTNSLPIELNQFSAKYNTETQIEVNWETTSEINNAYFELYHSLDGKKWELIHIKSGAGNSTQKIAYSFLHKGFSNGLIHYYQLIQVDKDGRSTMSNVISVKVNALSKTEIYPNPANEHFNLNFGDTDVINNVQVYDLTGKLRFNIEVTNPKTTNIIATDQLENGAYLIYVNGIMQGKLIIQH